MGRSQPSGFATPEGLHVLYDSHTRYHYRPTARGGPTAHKFDPGGKENVADVGYSHVFGNHKLLIGAGTYANCRGHSTSQATRQRFGSKVGAEMMG